MPKRRRERDRPKAAHDAIYNPNKRVLLSYESDEEQEEIPQVHGTPESPGDNIDVANYQIEEYPDEDLKDSAEIDLELDDETEVQKPTPAQDTAIDETPHGNESSLWTRGGHRNAATGQWAALGSLSYGWEDEEEDEEFDSEEEEAMAYLRAVRSERQAMPELFVAKNTYTTSELYDDGLGDTRGYFEDGAYIAAPTTGPETSRGTLDPQDAFISALKDRFLKQRQHLHTKPSPKGLEQLDAKHPTYLPKSNNKSHAIWHRALQSTAPQPTQLRAMDQTTVIRVLEMVQERFLKRETEISMPMSAWIWSLLARLDEVGVMNSERVSLLREFAKRAILVQVSFRDPETAAQLEGVARGEEGDQAPGIAKGDQFPVEEADDADVTTDSAAAAMTGKSEPSKDGHDNDSGGQSSHSPKEVNLTDLSADQKFENGSRRTNTLATLDTIIVLVGDVFGQRDLLEFRQPWTPDEEDDEE